MLNILAILLADFYKIGHPFQYPVNTRVVYSNLTPRKTRLVGVDGMVFFGMQYFIKEYLISYFNKNFFNLPKEEVLRLYKRRIKTSLGSDLASYKHIEDLHDLGYLPILIKAVPEGTRVKMRVPVLTITNTLPDQYWLPNFLETLLSCIIWQPCTSATIAHEYRKLLNKYAKQTGMPMEFIQWQGHDFSFRGMSSLETAITSGMGHLLSFTGTDTIPAIDALETYYNANADNELIGGSVNATEHSVMCAGSKDGEVATFKRLITEVYPAGFVSIVSDTWDLWKVLTHIVVVLKNEIMARNGRVVIRPDSGDPVDIICGSAINGKLNYDATGRAYPDNADVSENWNKVYINNGKYYKIVGPNTHKEWEEITPEPKHKGVVELLWDVFGGTMITGTDGKQYKLLDTHVGAIYGDSITLDRAKEISERLMAKGFAPQIVFGIGSYTYQYNTRDTFGTAMKATYVEIGDEAREIWKDPITDDGTKKSATGLLRVDNINGVMTLKDKVTKEEEVGGALVPVFEDGKLLVDDTLANIRARLAAIAE